MIKKCVILCLLVTQVICWATVKAQNDNVWDSYEKQFPDERAIFVDRAEVLTLYVDGDSLRASSDETEDILYLKDQGESASAKRVYGSHFTQVQDIKAKTLIWDKSRYREMKVSEFKKNSDHDGSVFYDDSYYYAINFPSVASHNRTQLQYHMNFKDARFISGFVFATYMPQVHAAFTIKTTRDVELVYQTLNDPQGLIKFKRTEKGNAVTYEWSAENVASIRVEEKSPSLRYYVPHIICYIKSYRTKKGIVNLATGIGDLHKWYSTFVAHLNEESSPALIDVVNQIKAKSKTEEDIVKNVYYWVQDNIQYIAFEDGMRGLIPHNGSYVCEKRYGDCKDMANLIVNMLELAGIKAYRTWIGTRDLPYRYTQVPTSLVDNHMIATYISPDKKYYFLDGTSDHTSFDFPSSMIQGKEALIAFGPDAYEVREVPIIEKEKNSIRDSVFLKIQNNEIAGKGVTSLSGYAKVFGGYSLERADQKDVKDNVVRLTGKGSNKFYLDDYKISNLESRSKPTEIAYTFRIGDYYQKIGNEIYVNLNLSKDFYNDFINLATRKSPMETEYKFVKNDYYELSVPDGYEVEYLPPNAKSDGALAGIDIQYQSLPGKIILTRRFYIDYLLMNTDQFEQWNKSIKFISDTYKESIILKKK